MSGFFFFLTMWASFYRKYIYFPFLVSTIVVLMILNVLPVSLMYILTCIYTFIHSITESNIWKKNLIKSAKTNTIKQTYIPTCTWLCIVYKKPFYVKWGYTIPECPTQPSYEKHHIVSPYIHTQYVQKSQLTNEMN